MHDPLPLEGDVPAGLLARLYGTKDVHRLLPARLALPLAAAFGPAVRQLRNPAERRAAEWFLTDLLLYTPRAGEESKLAGKWLAEKARMRELFWRPWLLRRSRLLGRDRWDQTRRARSSKRARSMVPTPDEPVASRRWSDKR